ncbi:MAG: ATP synthase F1 subunit gamma [Thermodesulfobacteriota bacterium]
MPSLQQINTKITSVRGTMRIMSAMKLIAAVKLQRAQSLLKAHRDYVSAYTKISSGVLATCEPDSHPLLFRPEEKKRAHVVFLTSDRGLCGNFNNVLIKGLDAMLEERGFDKGNLKMTFLGNKGRNFFAPRGLAQGSYYSGINESNYTEVSEELSTLLSREFTERETDEVIVVHSNFISALSRETVFDTFLPIEFPSDEQDPDDCVFEPSKEKIVEDLIPGYLRLRMEKSVLESLTSEHSARMTAMESATNNADELVKNLTLLFNKTRQAIITTELMDIVNGTEALREGGDD